MSEQKSKDRPLSEAEALSAMNALMKEIEVSPGVFERNLRHFVSIYVQKNNQSEDCFIALCEHEVIQKLFSPEGIKMGVLNVLELFNLILANTSNLNSLVYIFSLPSIHDFLFQKMESGRQSPQTVEYYAQLLKTIVLKMCNGQSALIKLFCNNRYPSFPLLCQLSYLATQAAEQLVRVTARQCMLVLIKLLNSKAVGRAYLAEVQMAVFFYELTKELISGNCDFEGCLRYFVDLMAALQHNEFSLSMLLNSFTMNVIINQLNDLPKVLRCIRIMSAMIEQHQQFPLETYRQIKIILGKVICKVQFNQFLSGAYLIAFKKKPTLDISNSKVTLGQLMKYYRIRFQNLQSLLQESDPKMNQSNRAIILPAWSEFNRNCQLKSIKGSPERKGSFISKFFNSKPDPFDQYIKTALLSNGFSLENNKVPLFKIEKTFNCATAIFFVQRQILRGEQKGMKRRQFEQFETNFNDNRGNFELKTHFCQEIQDMTGHLKEKHINLDSWLQKKKLGNVEFEYFFVCSLREYLKAHLADFVLLTEYEYTLQQISCMRNLVNFLGLSSHFQKSTLQKLLWKMEQLQSQINQLTFMRDFKLLIKYVLENYSQHLLKVGHNLNEYPDNLHDPICRKMFQYQFLNSIIDPKADSIVTFIKSKWKQYFAKEQNRKKMIFSQQTANYTSSIYPCSSMNFQVKLSKSTMLKPLAVNVLDVKELQKVIPGQGEAEKLTMMELRLACSQREEVITKWIVQYFETTYNRLCSLISKKTKNP